MGSYVHIADSLHIYKAGLGTFKVTQDADALSSITDGEKLEITFDETSDLFSSIYIDLIATAQLSKECDKPTVTKKLLEMFHPDSQMNSQRPMLIRNILAVIGSDAARRLNQPDIIFELLNHCTDLSLQKAAIDWIVRNQAQGESNG